MRTFKDLEFEKKNGKETALISFANNYGATVEKLSRRALRKGGYKVSVMYDNDVLVHKTINLLTEDDVTLKLKNIQLNNI